MSSIPGSTFDGLDTANIVIDATAQTKNYTATDTENQYQTTATNMSFKTASSNSTYTFKDGTGAANTSLVARDGLFTGAITAQYQTITPIPSQTVPGVTITGPYLNNNANIPLLKVEKTQGGVNSEFSNISESYPVLKLLNTSSSPTYLQYSQATNLPSGSSISHLFGKDTSSNANAFLMQYYYDTLEANRKFTIRAWGDSISALEIYKSAVTGTSATTGSVVVNGDLGSTGLRSKSLTLYGTSGSARIIPATTTTSYQLTLPSSIGAVNDYLQLGSVSGTNGTLQWVAGTGGGGGSSAYIAAAAYSNSSFTFNTSGTFYTLTFPTTDYNVNTGITYGTGGQSSLFQNVSGGSLYIHVNGYINFNSNATGTRTIQVITYNGSTTSYFNATRAAATSSGSTEIIVTSIVLVANNQWFGVRAMEDATNGLGSSCKIQFSVLGGSGTQSVTLSALSTNQASTLFTTTTQQTGQNPTVSFDLAQTPTGSGKFVLATSPTISGLSTTGTLTSSSISATSVDTSSLSTSALSESAFVVDISNTTTYPTPVLNLDTTNTFIILNGTRTGFSVYLPQANTVSIGRIIKIVNNSSSLIYVKQYGISSVYDPIYQNQTTYYTLIDNTGIYSLIGLWKPDVLVDASMAKLTQDALLLMQDTSLKLQVVEGTNVSVSAATGSSAWNFILPLNAGTPGQVLTTQGGTNAMTWADAFTNQSVFNSTLAGHIFGATDTSVASNPIIRLRGISTQNNQPVLSVLNSSTTSCTTTTSLAPNLLNSNFIAKRMGVSPTNYNSISERFYYEGDGSLSNNYTFNFYGQNPSLKIYPLNILASSTAGTLQVDGGVKSTNIYTGDISAANITVRSGGTISGNLDLTTVNATTVTTTNLVVNGSAVFGNSYGTSTCVFNYGSSPYTPQPPDPTITYPFIQRIDYPYIGGGSIVANQSYKWQQMGFLYSFAMNIRVNLTLNTGSNDIRVGFIETAVGDPNPPIPHGQADYMPMQESGGAYIGTEGAFGVTIPARYFITLILVFKDFMLENKLIILTIF